jgi:hypothetical protein
VAFAGRQRVDRMSLVPLDLGSQAQRERPERATLCLIPCGRSARGHICLGRPVQPGLDRKEWWMTARRQPRLRRRRGRPAPLPVTQRHLGQNVPSHSFLSRRQLCELTAWLHSRASSWQQPSSVGPCLRPAGRRPRHVGPAPSPDAAPPLLWSYLPWPRVRQRRSVCWRATLRPRVGHPRQRQGGRAARSGTSAPENKAAVRGVRRGRGGRCARSALWRLATAAVRQQKGRPSELDHRARGVSPTASALSIVSSLFSAAWAAC